MKMIYNGTPIESMKLKHYEVDTNSATVQPSDLQAGITCFAKGKKMTGTGKSFEFAYYGMFIVNFPIEVPSNINVIEVASLTHPIKITIALNDMKNKDFSTTQQIAIVVDNGVEYPITVNVQDGILTLNCDIDLDLQMFYGKDNYV